MEVIIAGSRSITDPEIVETAISDSEFEITKVISGTADGVDTIGEQWAAKNSIPVIRYPPNKFEEEADDSEMPPTIYRNMKMAEDADAAIIVWDGTSPGTKTMLSFCKRKDIPFELHRTDSRDLADFAPGQ